MTELREYICIQKWSSATVIIIIERVNIYNDRCEGNTRTQYF